MPAARGMNQPAQISEMTDVCGFHPSMPPIKSQLPQSNGPSESDPRPRQITFSPSNVPRIPKLRIFTSNSLRGRLASAQLRYSDAGDNNPSAESSMNMNNLLQRSFTEPPKYFIQQLPVSDARPPRSPVSLTVGVPNSGIRVPVHPAQVVHAKRTTVTHGSSAPKQPLPQVPHAESLSQTEQSLPNNSEKFNRPGRNLVLVTQSNTHFRCSRCTFTASNADRVIRHVLRSHFSQYHSERNIPASTTFSPHEAIPPSGSISRSTVTQSRDVDVQVPSPDKNNDNRNVSHSSSVDGISSNNDLSLPLLSHSPLLKSTSRDLQANLKQDVPPSRLVRPLKRVVRARMHIVSKLRQVVKPMAESSTTQNHSADSPSLTMTSGSHLSQCLGIETPSLTKNTVNSSDQFYSTLSNTLCKPVCDVVTSKRTVPNISRPNGSRRKRVRRNSYSLSHLSKKARAKPPLINGDELPILPVSKSPAYSAQPVSHAGPDVSNRSSSCLSDPESNASPLDAVSFSAPVASDTVDSPSRMTEDTTQTRLSPELLVDISSLVFRPLNPRSPDSQVDVTDPMSPIVALNISPDRTSTPSVDEHMSGMMVSPSEIVPTPSSLTTYPKPICSISSTSSSSLSSLDDNETDDLIFVGFSFVGKANGRRLKVGFNKCKRDPSKSECNHGSKVEQPHRNRSGRRSLNTSSQLAKTSAQHSIKRDSSSHSNIKVSVDAQVIPNPSVSITKKNQIPAPVNGKETMGSTPTVALTDIFRTPVSEYTLLQSDKSLFEPNSFLTPHRHAPRTSSLYPVPTNPLTLASAGSLVNRPADRITVDLVTGELFVDNRPLRELVGGMRLTRTTPWRLEPEWNSRASSRGRRPFSYGPRRGRPRKTHSITASVESCNDTTPMLLPVTPTNFSTPNKKNRPGRPQCGTEFADVVSKAAASHVRKRRGRSRTDFIGRRKHFSMSPSPFISVDKFAESSTFPSSSR